MTTLVTLRGLPASGKSTYARAWVQESPDTRAEVNRDAIRLMLGGYVLGSSAQEKMVTRVQHKAIRDLLIAGIDVISSDTNLALRYVNDLYKIARAAGAEVYVIDMTDVPVETCVVRNAQRADKAPVPTDVITRMYNKSILGKGYPLPLPTEDSAGKAPDFYVGNYYLPWADICDIDGTVASHEGMRSPYDYSKVSLDRPRNAVIDVLTSRVDSGQKLIFMSGRPDIDNVRADTEEWLADCVCLPYEMLLMRPADRQQVNDAVVKRDLFDEHIRGRYNIAAVFDDRDRVVDMWRRQLGLTCFQVNYGDF
jgi:predicted kinase